MSFYKTHSCPYTCMEVMRRDLRNMERDMRNSIRHIEDSHHHFGGPCPLHDQDDPMSLAKLNKTFDTSQSTNKMFIATLKLDGFTPDEVTVKVKKGKVIVSGNHEETSDDHHGTTEYRSKRFSNQYNLPPSVDEAHVKQSFEDGRTLKIEAPFCEPRCKDKYN
ncbi:outer dense fiber protein 1 [Pelodytes ibericus]